MQRARDALELLSLTPPEAARRGISLNQDGVRRTALQLLAYPTITVEKLARIWPQLAEVPRAVVERLETDATYAVYLDRQAADIAAYRRDEGVVLAEGINFGALPGLSAEIAQKLVDVQPRTLGQAARIEGVTPAALTLLAAHARRKRDRVPAAIASAPSSL